MLNSALTVICIQEQVQNSEKISVARQAYSQLILNQVKRCSALFQLSYSKQVSFSGHIYYHIFLIFVLLLMIPLFKIAAKYSAECPKQEGCDVSYGCYVSFVQA